MSLELREVLYATVLVLFGLAMGWGMHSELTAMHSTTIEKGDRL